MTSSMLATPSHFPREQQPGTCSIGPKEGLGSGKPAPIVLSAVAAPPTEQYDKYGYTPTTDYWSEPADNENIERLAAGYNQHRPTDSPIPIDQQPLIKTPGAMPSKGAPSQNPWGHSHSNRLAGGRVCSHLGIVRSTSPCWALVASSVRVGVVHAQFLSAVDAQTPRKVGRGRSPSG